MRRWAASKRLAMEGRWIRLMVCLLVLCFGGSAGAQGRGETLYAAQCERCHKSPKGVTTFHGGVDLETFLGELHHADTSESAASIAAYLKELERAQGRSDEAPKKRHSRRTKQRSDANPRPELGRPVATSAASTQDNLLKRTLKMLLGWANP